MRIPGRFRSGFVFALAALVVGCPSESSRESPHAPGDVSTLGWIVGSWRDEQGGSVVVEEWHRSGDALVGAGRTVENGKTTFSERLRIEVRDGTLRYIATLPDSEPVVFTAVSLSENEAVFENPQHDYPQRIVYARVTPDSLYARVEGKADGEDQMDEFFYSRARTP